MIISSGCIKPYASGPYKGQLAIQLDVLKEKHDDIGNVVLIKSVINKTFEVLLMSVYGPNEDNTKFYRDFSIIIDDMRDGDDALPVMLCGDLNIALDQQLDAYNYDRENNAGNCAQLTFQYNYSDWSVAVTTQWRILNCTVIANHLTHQHCLRV